MTEQSLRNGARFASVVLDVDSTLSRIEGVEWLAALRDASVSREVVKVTERAMRGEIALEDVYAARLDLVRPTRAELVRLGGAYVDAVASGAREAVAELRAAGVHVVLVSGGLRDAILPLARLLDLPDTHVHAVPIRFTSVGDYAGFHTEYPLARNGGKPTLVRTLGLKTPVLAVGDGITDAELKTVPPPAVDAFAAFTGVVTREPVVRAADYTITQFDQLPSIVLS